MLIQFNFGNYKSFRDINSLDLTATKMNDFSNHIVLDGNEKVLPVVALFGANASGKSNVIDAFRFMSYYVINSFAFSDVENDRKSLVKILKPTPFLLDEEFKDKESFFEVFFTLPDTPGKIFQYGFTLNKEGIVEEWLNTKARTSSQYKVVFYRSFDECDFSGIKKSKEIIQSALDQKTLLVSLGAKLKIAVLKKVRDWFYDCNAVNFGDPVENVLLAKLLPNDFTEDVTVQDEVIKYFSSFDSSIIGFNVEELKSEEDDDEDTGTIKVESLHQMIGSENIAKLNFRDESAGTLKMFSLYPVLLDTLQKGSVLLIDELNARLHPLLVRNIIITFFNKKTNPNHAQLIFTSHDAWQLSNSSLRRDEIWFTEKSHEGISTLYSLADFTDENGVHIRKDESYQKNYLLGKYGAIPHLELLEFFDTNGKE